MLNKQSWKINVYYWQYIESENLNKLMISVEMEIHEQERNELLGNEAPNDVNTATNRKQKNKRKGVPLVQMPKGPPSPSTGLSFGTHDPLSVEISLANELLETKQRLEIANREMEGMRNEMAEMRKACPRPLKIFALGFIPSVALAKPNVELLKWVADVLSLNMKKRMESHQEHFNVIKTIAGIEAVGVRTCPIYNRIEFCALKWHSMTKMTKTGRPRAELRIHCCTLCLEALGIICGHPLLRCPWIYEDTWKKIPGAEEATGI